MVAPRYWSYWTETKLEILEKYLPAFNIASKRVGPTLYLDLMSGEPENVAKRTGLPLDGSPRIAIKTTPPFGRIMLFERDRRRAAEWRDEIASLDRKDEARVSLYEGDCNTNIGNALDRASIEGYRRRPVFALIDQQVAEVGWDTLRALAGFRAGRYKSEVWMLVSPTWMYRSLCSDPSGLNLGTASRITRMYGSPAWDGYFQARREGRLNPETFGDEMVNLMRWQLQQELGYRHTARIPLTLLGTRQKAYEMVFATDNDTGLKIMASVYQKASLKHKGMAQEARAAVRNQADQRRAQGVLFANAPEDVDADFIPKWEPDEPWEPGAPGTLGSR